MFIHAAALTPMIGSALAARLSWETEVVLVAAPLFAVETPLCVAGVGPDAIWSFSAVHFR